MSLYTAPHFTRGILLLHQNKPDQAEREFRQHLASDPQDGLGHAYLGICLSEQKRYDEAERETKQGIHLAPDNALPHYALASVLHDRRRLDEAERAIQEAIRLDPTDAGQYALLASVELQRKRWRAAADAAGEGLKFDPEHVGCTNVRAIALRNLGDRVGADQTVERLLERDPENAVAHANQGWALLSAGKPREAMESFREALRLDPNLEWARAGLVNAMKARNFLFRWLLQFFIWMSRLSTQAQWGLIIGLFIGVRVLRSMAAANPALAPFVLPIIVAYAIFVYLTWTANPLFNLVLRLDRIGRYALSREEITASNCVLACILGVIGGLVWWWLDGFDNERGAVLAIMCGLMVIPVSAIFMADSGWPRQAMTGYVGLMLVLGVVSLIGMNMTPEPTFTQTAFSAYLLGALASSWVGVALAQARPTR